MLVASFVSGVALQTAHVQQTLNNSLGLLLEHERPSHYDILVYSVSVHIFLL